MNRIDRKFKELQKMRKKAFIAYICAGDPDLRTTEELVYILESSGADIIELGVPFSDPLADGPTIQAASQRALKKGVYLKKIFTLIRSLRKKTQVPIVLMGYYNPILRYGLTNFISDAVSAGADGAIIPDLPVEEAGDFIKQSRKFRFSSIFLISPTTTTPKIKEIISKSTGFIYYVSLTGVTGARESLPAGISADVKRIKRYTKKPVCVGFGISRPSQVKQISSFADGVIVGSAIIKKIEANLGNRDKILHSVASLIKKLISNYQ
ncbi:MAG: tryptophan synthase subunit alpha [Candidatus Omnitrophota bacterium]